MWQTFRLTSEIEKTIVTNKFIFSLKRNLLFKYIFKNLEYGNYNIKKRFYLLALIFDFIKKFLTTIIIASVSVGYPLFIALNNKGFSSNKHDFFMHLFICFYVFWGCLANSTLFRTDENKFVYIKLMHMDAKKYVFSQFIIKRVYELICEILIFGTISYLLSGFIFPILTIIFAKFVFRCFGEMLHLFLYKKTGKIFERSPLQYFILLSVTALAAYSPFIINITPIYNESTILILTLGLISFGVLGFLYMLNFQDYYDIIINVTKVKNIRLDSEELKNVRIANIRLKDTNLAPLKIEKSENKYGFDYFNTIFFERFKTAFRKPLKIKIVSIIILSILCLCFGFWFPEFKNSYSFFILNYSYILIYVLFTIFNQDKFTKMMFYNCDLPLFKYRLYLNKDTVYLVFKQRLKKLLFLNLIPASLITVTFLALEFVFFHKINAEILLLSIFVILISAFLTVSNLSLYYLLQPYSSSIEVKNYTYHYVPNLFMFLLVMLLSMKLLSLQIFLQIFSIFLIICLPALFILVKKFSFKTFKVKN